MAEHDTTVYTNVATKLWGHGRLLQMARLALCKRKGHYWSRWNVDPPEDELGRPLDPGPDSRVFCFRGCRAHDGVGCGTVQHVTIKFSQLPELQRYGRR